MQGRACKAATAVAPLLMKAPEAANLAVEDFKIRSYFEHSDNTLHTYMICDIGQESRPRCNGYSLPERQRA